MRILLKPALRRNVADNSYIKFNPFVEKTMQQILGREGFSTVSLVKLLGEGVRQGNPVPKPLKINAA